MADLTALALICSLTPSPASSSSELMARHVLDELATAEATGPNVVAEYFRDGTDPDWGSPLIVSGFGDGEVVLPWQAGAGSGSGTSITTSTGERRVIPRQTDFGTMSSGGLY